jgi:hypothetical protein
MTKLSAYPTTTDDTISIDLDGVKPIQWEWDSATDYSSINMASGSLPSGALPGFTAQDIGHVLTTNGTGDANWSSPYTVNTSQWPTTPMTVGQSGTLQLDGENADIKINGESLNETLREIKEALLVPRSLHRNTELENEFDELKQFALEYEQRVKEFKEKKRVWDILKKEE